MQIGNLTIEPVHDGTMRAPVSASRGTTVEQWAPHRQFLDADGMLEFALGGFLIRTPGERVVLVDAGIGDRSGAIMSGSGTFQGGAMLNNLAALGVQPEQVTDVIFTHLHFDHVGWASADGVRVFPN